MRRENSPTERSAVAGECMLQEKSGRPLTDPDTRGALAQRTGVDIERQHSTGELTLSNTLLSHDTKPSAVFPHPSDPARSMHAHPLGPWSVVRGTCAICSLGQRTAGACYVVAWLWIINRRS